MLKAQQLSAVSVSCQQSRSQPLFLYILSFTELADRFHYYGLQALIVLYLTKWFQFSDGSAYELYGVFTASSFALPILGGAVGDRVLGYYHSMLLGFTLLIFANISFALLNLDGVYCGLALTICGIALFKSNAASYVGTLYGQEDIRRDAGFSIFYIGMNAGALLGPVVYGFLAMHYGWRSAFVTSAFAISATFFILMVSKIILAKNSPASLLTRNVLKELDKKLPWKIFVTYASLPLAVICVLFFLHQCQWFGSLLGIVGMVTIITILFVAFKSNCIERGNLLALLAIIFFCIFFFMCSFQVATSLTLFIERQVDRTFGSLQLPTMMFLSLQPLFVIVTVPFISKIWLYLDGRKYSVSSGAKIALGLLFAAISFIVFSAAAKYHYAGYHFSLWGVVMGDWLLAVGELCILPVTLSAISRYAPRKWQSSMIGVFFLALSFSGYFAGLLAKIMNSPQAGAMAHSISYVRPFFEIGLLTFFISILVFIVNIIWIRKALNENHSIVS